jgi:hypothetical protein
MVDLSPGDNDLSKANLKIGSGMFLGEEKSDPLKHVADLSPDDDDLS